MKDFGYIQVYTGNGKGKTTAAMGLALRAAGRGCRVFIAQFMKQFPYGEIKAIRDFLGHRITIEQFGLPDFHTTGEQVKPEEIEAARRGLDAVRSAWKTGEYQVIVLDEVNVLLHFGIISKEEFAGFMRERPKNVELICTGRYAPDELIAMADLVTEMREIKHYYAAGVEARRGIEK